MNDLQITGKQEFMGKELPVVLGGFGEDKRCLSDKTIAEIHGQPVFEIRRRVNDNIKRFVESVDIIDLKQRMGESHTLELLKNLGYAKQSITQAEHIYILSERGYAKLIKIMDSDLAWEIHDKLIDEYFQLREQSHMNYEEVFQNPDTVIQIATQWREERVKRLVAEQQIEVDRPKVLFADAVSASHTSILIGDLAKLLKQNGHETGQKRLFEWLRQNGYLIKMGESKNMPTQKAMEQGLFEVKETVVNNPDGSIRTTKTTKVTGKGQIYFINLFNANRDEKGA